MNVRSGGMGLSKSANREGRLATNTEVLLGHAMGSGLGHLEALPLPALNALYPLSNRAFPGRRRSYRVAPIAVIRWIARTA